MEAIFLQSDIIWTQLETLFLASLENNCNVGLMPSTGTIILKWKQLVPLFLASLMLPQVAIVTLLDVEPISDLLTAGRRSKTSKTKTLSTWATKEIRFELTLSNSTQLNLTYSSRISYLSFSFTESSRMLQARRPEDFLWLKAVMKESYLMCTKN